MNILSAENSYVRFFIQYSLPFIVIGIISRTFPITSPAYFIVPVLLLINILLVFILIPRTNKTLTYFFIIFALPLYCLITSIWSLNPIISLQRSLYLLLLYAGILSSVLLYKKFYPDKGIGFLIPANIMILVLSAVSLIFGIPEDSWSGGNGLGFMGFAGHQNTLAAAILFTLPGIVAWGLDKSGFPLRSNIAQNATSRVFRLSSYSAFGGLLLVSNVLLLILTYSRASILALVIGTITYLIITKSKKILAILFIITALLVVLYFTIPFIQNSFDSVLTKDGGKILGRRMILWEPSLEAAKLGGVFGLGYGVSAPAIKTPVLTGSHYEDGRYIREKGNSVLAMIEETGLIGLILFLLPMIWIIRKFIIYNSQFTIKENLRSNSTFYIVHCTLFAMLVHAQFEAWWVGVGSVAIPLFLIFLFMTLSSTYFFKSNTETK
jgi:O-antigen ligase